MYIDLLAFPANAGGRDTPSRLGWVAADLGYSTIGLFSKGARQPYPWVEIPGIQLVRVAEEGAARASTAGLRVAVGKRARHAAIAGTADFILPHPNDVKALRSAGENYIPVAYAYSWLLREQSAKRSNLIRIWSAMHESCRKHGCVEILVSAADDSYLLRDPRDVVCAMSNCLGIASREVLDWITSAPQEILRRAEERRGH